MALGIVEHTPHRVPVTDSGEDGIALLKRVVDSRADAPDLPALAALTERIQAYLDGAAAGVTLEQALGIAAGPKNGAPWFRGESRERRNAELRAMVACFHPPGSSVRAQAIWLRNRIRRYASTSWPRDRKCSEMPPRYADTEKQYLFRAFNASPPPSGERQLRTILGRGGDWQSHTRFGCQ